jgi:predicted ATP-dependent endonuclease of OLD family
MEQEESAYITSVHLKGYKSIRDVSVTLNKGLNILIGANGSGKTNFLEFLDAAIEYGFNYSLVDDKIEYRIDVNDLSITTKIEQIFDRKVKDTLYKVEETISKKDKSNTAIYFYDGEKRFLKTQRKHKENCYYFYNTLFVKFYNPLDSLLKKKSI